MYCSLCCIISSRPSRDDPLGWTRLSGVICLFPHRVPSQQRRWWRSRIPFSHSTWSNTRWRYSSCVGYAHDIICSCVGLVEVSSQDVMGRPDIVLIHEMSGPIPNAVDVTNSSLVIVIG